MPNHEFRASFAVRVLALLFVLIGVWMLVCNLIETVAEFNPAYAYYYFENQLLRPFIAIILGFVLFKLSTRVARLLLRGLKE